MTSRVLTALRTLGRRSAVEKEMDEEMRFHLDMETRKLVERGLSPEEARRKALLSFGGVEQHKESCLDETGAPVIETLFQDIRYGVRGLRRNPVFAAAAVVTLALGIGANAAIFSVVHGVFLQALPYGGGDRLVRLRQDAPGINVTDFPFSPVEISDYASRNHTLAGLAEYHSMWFVLLGKAEPERVQTGVVAANFFDVLGVEPLIGRTFRAGEDAPGAEPLLVLSHDYWMRSWGGDRGIVGRTLRMNDRIHTVIGVLPPIPAYPDDNDVYMPVSACPFRKPAGGEPRPGPPDGPGLRAAEARRVAFRGALGPRGHRTEPRRAIPGLLSGEGERLCHDGRFAPRRADAGGSPDVPGPLRHRRARAPARVRQRRQSHARAPPAPAAGARAALRSRRRAAAARPTARHGEHPRRARRRRARPPLRLRQACGSSSPSPPVSRRGRARSRSTARSSSSLSPSRS